MKKMHNKIEHRARRHQRVRAKIKGMAECPRVTIFRSLQGVSLQAIDDQAKKTLAQANYQELKKGAKNTVMEAKEIGKLLGGRLMKLGIKTVVFDRSGYLYHGKVKAAADGLRESGIAL